MSSGSEDDVRIVTQRTRTKPSPAMKLSNIIDESSESTTIITTSTQSAEEQEEVILEDNQEPTEQSQHNNHIEDEELDIELDTMERNRTTSRSSNSNIKASEILPPVILKKDGAEIEQEQNALQLYLQSQQQQQQQQQILLQAQQQRIQQQYYEQQQQHAFTSISFDPHYQQPILPIPINQSPLLRQGTTLQIGQPHHINVPIPQNMPQSISRPTSPNGGYNAITYTEVYDLHHNLVKKINWSLTRYAKTAAHVNKSLIASHTTPYHMPQDRMLQHSQMGMDPYRAPSAFSQYGDRVQGPEDPNGGRGYRSVPSSVPVSQTPTFIAGPPRSTPSGSPMPFNSSPRRIPAPSVAPESSDAAAKASSRSFPSRTLSSENMYNRQKDRLRKSSSAQDLNSVGSSKPGTPNPEEQRPFRRKANHEQLAILEDFYKTTKLPTLMEKEMLADKAQMNVKVVQHWFQNTRAKDRRMHREMKQYSEIPTDEDTVKTEKGKLP